MARRPAPQPIPDFWWFNGQSVTRLINKLTTTENPRLVVKLKNGKMTFEVVNHDTGIGHDPINDSHACPPTCP